jgi:hypothetical protein
MEAIRLRPSVIISPIPSLKPAAPEKTIAVNSNGA